MHNTSIRSFLAVALSVAALAIAPSSWAQLTSTGMTGYVRDTAGQAVSGATVTAVYTPTNASFRAISNDSGRFNFRGLPIGGPYTLSTSASGYTADPVNDIFTELGNDVEANLTIKSDVIVMEKFVTTASSNELDASASGAGTLLSSQRLENRPTSERSLADMISASALVTLRSTQGDREESMITAVGQNNRFNSIQIDGSRVNDTFGLNATGLAAFFNPLSLDTIDQLSVQVSPYDVRQAGFTGASVNAVTKSGTNKFKGSIYYHFQGDETFGYETRGPNARDLLTSGAKITPRLDRQTYGVTLGGPIWKDRLFFFAAYEKFESTSPGRDPRFRPAAGVEAQVLARLQQYSTASGRTINWGNPVTAATANSSEDEKINLKLDWLINSDHRLSVRHTTTEGLIPQFGTFANTTTGNINGVNGGIVTSADGHFYSQTREGKTIAVQLSSQWSPNFKTEIKYSKTTDDQLTPINTVAPFVMVTGLSGTDLFTGASVTNGTFTAGTERFRQGNVINVEGQQMSATADYFWKNFVFTGGFEREQTDFFNLFRQGSYGLVAFRNLADFLADTNAAMTRNVIDPAFRPVADISELGTTGIFAQAKWDVNPRLWIVGGLRYEFVESGIAPALNQTFLATTGFRNNGTIDGTSSISPRVGFNLALDDDRRTQVRGGFGHFFGRSPWVFFSNSYGQTGVGTFTQANATGQIPNSFTSYLQTQFDPANPIGNAADNPADPTRRREINWVDNKTELPQVWRGNLALEHRMDFLNSTVTVEAIYTMNDQSLFITNENIRSIGTGADGRPRYAGAPFAGTGTAALFPAYTDLLRIRNTGVGESTYLSLQWDRPMRNKWGFNFSYTRGKATEAQALGQTTAGGQWNRNAVFRQNTVENGTSDFQVRDRIQLSFTRQLELVKNWRTTASLSYEGRTGNPYSWVYNGDLNGDGRNDNDLVAVPTDQNDTRFDFSGMTSAQREAMFAFINTSGLAKYAGGVAPKNEFTEPWVNKLDLKLTQDVPLWGVGEFKPKLQLFFDFINFGSFISASTFGYNEVTVNSDFANSVFRTRFLGGAAYGADGRIRPTFTADPANFVADNFVSRWRIQLGAKLSF